MKKIYSYVMLAAVAAAALVSCAKELDKPEVAPQKGFQISVVTESIQTKTAIASYGVGSASVAWTEGDRVGFFNLADGVNIQSGDASISAGKATFTATVETDGTYYAYYPYQNETGSNAPNAQGVTSRIPNAQKLLPNSFDPAADLLVSTGFAASGSTDTPASIQFKRLGAFIRLSFTDGATPDLSAQTVNSITIARVGDIEGSEPEKNLSAIFRVNADGAVYQNSGYKSITATVDATPFTLTSDAAYIGIRPQTIPAGAKLNIIVDAADYTITRQITMPSDQVIGAGAILPISINIIDDYLSAKTLQLVKVWGNYGVAGVAGWPAYVAGAEDLDTMLRNACFDDDYVYIPKTSTAATGGSFDEASIFMFKMSDGTYAGKVQRTTDPDYMAGTWASTFPVSCVRMMKNTNPSVNGGKDILIATNLCDGQNVRVYAWENGIAAQPKLVSNFSNGRRMGDRISVDGTYQNGRIYYRNFYTQGMVAWLSVTNGTTPEYGFDALGAIETETENCASEYKAMGSGYALISSNLGTGLRIVQGTSLMDTYVDYKRCYGWDAFTFRGENYLAYLDMAGGTNLPIVRILRGATDSYANLKATLETKDIALQGSIATSDPTDLATTGVYATNNQGDCQVRFINGVPYVLGMSRGGLVLFKIVYE